MAEGTEAKAVSLSINRVIPKELKGSKFANDVVIQHAQGSFTISFFEILIPIILEKDEEKRNKIIKELKEIEAHCVARVTLSPNQLLKMLDAIQENIIRYETQFGPIEKPKE